MGDAAAAAAGDAPATPTSILICREDGSDLFPDADDGGADLSFGSDDRLLAVDRDEEYVAVLLSKERASTSASAAGEEGASEEEMEEWMKATRSGCTAAMFRLGGVTAYFAVTYLDRFLAQWRDKVVNESTLHVLAVACLSLAAKVEEYRAPRLSEFQLDTYEFDSATLLRVELVVLAELQWRMITVTPFSFISCFAARLPQDERRAIIRRAVECVFAAIKVMSSVEYQPSTIALASILVARSSNDTATSNASLDELMAMLGSPWSQLDTGHVYSCYSVMIQEDKSSMHSRAEVASSGVSAVAHVESPDASVDANNATAPASAATPENKRRRLH
ncbi:hypothetical protein ACP4OV_015667 [Aristida adscensionis]